MTFQNIFSSMADFRAVVLVLPCSPTNKGKNNLCGSSEKANRQWAFVAVWLSSYVNIKTAAAFANWLAPKKDALFSLIYFFGSFCIYYIPHNYTIPQVMPHAIPQTHSAFYPHRYFSRQIANCSVASQTTRLNTRLVPITATSQGPRSKVKSGRADNWNNIFHIENRKKE